MRDTQDGDNLFGPDWTALARDAFEDGTSVLSGCSPSKGTGDSVDVGSGEISVNGTSQSVSSQNVSIAARSSFDRYDLIVLDGSGNASSVTGQNQLETEPIPADNVLAAIVLVPSDSGVAITVNDARILTNQIFIDTILTNSLTTGTLTADEITANSTLEPPKETSDPAATAGRLWYREDID